MPDLSGDWQEIADVPQEVLDHTASVIVSARKSGRTIVLSLSEATAILCALAPYSTPASNALEN